MLKVLCIVAAVVVGARAQYYGSLNQPFGASATAGGFGANANAASFSGSFGGRPSGATSNVFSKLGAIQFPTNAPHHGLPVLPQRPGNNAYPTNNVGPVRPVNPGRHVNPVRPVNPTGPFNPGRPINPVNPTGPFNPTRPVNPGVGGNFQSGFPSCRPGAQVRLGDSRSIC